MTSRRLPLVLLLVYVGFVAYGSFSPFDFAYDPDRIRRFLDHPLPRLHDADGRRLVSLPDVVSNVLLGVPFGVLMAWSGMAGGPLATRVLRLVLADTAIAGAVEAGQLFAPSRTSSLPDVVAQVAGALAGLLVAHALSGAAPRPLGPRLARALGDRPARALLLALAAILAADAFYPYAVTRDVSTVWHNVGSAQWRPLGGPRSAFWPDLLVEKVLPWAALGGLARVALVGVGTARGGLVAWAAATALGVALEGGKLFIVGRAPSVDGVLLAAAGALVGVALDPALAGVAAEPARASAWLAASAAALLAYEELTPFSVLRSAAAVRARVARVEWLPFASYYLADPQSALFDAGKKLVLGAALGAAMRYASPRPGLVLVLVAQVFQPAHIASVGDVRDLRGRARRRVPGRARTGRELSLTIGRRGYALNVMMSWPLSRTLLLALMLVLSVLTPLAYASPPDPTWVSGFFDDGDYDDAVFVITSSAATLDPFPLDDSAPVPVHEPAPVGEDARPTAYLCLTTADARASPISGAEPL